ncbi:MAG TPA: 3-methyl-2-oxobutanoate hydroxymethyltransferase, partial [Spirochaetota bacterium]|nr:3-methyl-2-oxobutanoate hydroxymethyltransferase [Spirochaetota bacterium]
TDLIGVCQNFKPKFVKQFVNVGESIKIGVSSYIEEINNLKFPGESNVFSISDDTIEILKGEF